MKNTMKFVKKEIGEVTFENLKTFITKRGWEVYRYTIDDNLLTTLNINAYAKKNNSFCYYTKNTRIIFILRDIDKEYATKLLAHEVAHIILEHITITKDIFIGDNISFDIEANFFANKLLRKSYLKHIITCGIGLCIATIILIAIPSKFNHTVDIPNNFQDSTNFTKTEIDLEKVVITKTGTKYHLPNCRYVLNKTNTTSIPIEEATNNSFSACKVCIDK